MMFIHMNTFSHIYYRKIAMTLEKILKKMHRDGQSRYVATPSSLMLDLNIKILCFLLDNHLQSVADSNTSLK